LAQDVTNQELQDQELTALLEGAVPVITHTSAPAPEPEVVSPPTPPFQQQRYNSDIQYHSFQFSGSERLLSVLRIRTRMFLGLLDPDPLVRGIDPEPDPSIIKQK
jgi:hypothetical protein